MRQLKPSLLLAIAGNIISFSSSMENSMLENSVAQFLCFDVFLVLSLEFALAKDFNVASLWVFKHHHLWEFQHYSTLKMQITFVAAESPLICSNNCKCYAVTYFSVLL
jgi:hypothetical protein